MSSRLGRRGRPGRPARTSKIGAAAAGGGGGNGDGAGFTFLGATTGAFGNSGGKNVTIPAEASAGNYFVMVIDCNGVPSIPAGFTTLAQQASGQASRAYGKVLDSADITAGNFAYTTSSNFSAVNCGLAFSFSGTVATAGTAVIAGPVVSTSIACGNHTTDAEAMVFYNGRHGLTGFFNLDITDGDLATTERASIGTGAGSDRTMEVHTAIADAAATYAGPTYTNPDGSSVMDGFTFSLKVT